MADSRDTHLRAWRALGHPSIRRVGDDGRGYSQADPFKEALVKTFDGRHPCPICKFVAQGKKSEQKQETQKLLTKLDFFLDSPRIIIFPPRVDPPRPFATRTADTRKESPPTPPPRLLPG